jgi:hypothetical protein
MGEIAAEIGPHLKPGATVTDVGSVKQAVVEAVARICPQACISSRAIRWPGPNIPARGRALPRCSRTAGGC